MIESRYEIAADGQNLRVYFFKFANTRLVGGELARSTTGERGRKESQDDGLLAAKIGEFHGMIILIGKSEVGSGIADFKSRVLGRRLLRKKRAGAE
jgi:hypothetical protein